MAALKSECIICDDESLNPIYERSSVILEILEKYSSFINSFVIDFFVDDLWSNVPLKWQNALENVDPLTLSAFLDSSKPFRQIVKIVSTNVECNHVIDVGSGQGHLSRNLAFEGNFHVTSFDAEDCHVSAAKILDHKMKLSLQKQNRSEFDLNLTHIAKFIPSGITEDDFIKLLQIEGEHRTAAPFMLVGLHTCGNLASTMVEVFTRCPSAVALLSVSCCYMKLDAQSFPLSQKLKLLSNSSLSYHAREASCHAIEKHVIRLKSGEITLLKIHCYRAILESLIVKYHPLRKHSGLRSVKNAHEMTFAEYAKSALYNTGLHVPEEEFTSSFVESCMNQWKCVVVFYFLRLFLAMLVESVILLDKMLFLKEKDRNYRYYSMSVTRTNSLTAEKVDTNHLSRDLLWNIFLSALNSYRHDTLVRPFPPFYIGESGEKDFHMLKEIANSVTTLDSFPTTDCENLIKWVMRTKHFSLHLQTETKFAEILLKTGQAGETCTPTHIFEIIYNQTTEEKFQNMKGNKPVLYAYHGSRLENFHSILHNGLQNHLNKNSLFGDGTYVSTELSVCMVYSPSALAWHYSSLGDKLSCVAVCEIIDHPEMKSQILRAKPGRTMRQQMTSNGVPEKYYVIQNDELIRIKYLFVFSSRTTPINSRFEKLIDSLRFLGEFTKNMVFASQHRDYYVWVCGDFVVRWAVQLAVV
uniref:Poly [ADP-ribose] polymerase n=1 Tax=Strigamia maritima TaxID=126957 RepID=T1JDR7_STRMM